VAPDEAASLEQLRPFVGEWSIEMIPPGGEPSGDVGARVTFEFMPGERFLVERWSVPFPDAPDGLAIIGHDEDRGTLLQHYFDERGVARVYEMRFADGVWELERTSPADSDDFSQRFFGTFSEDGQTIEGRWEICHDARTWEHDFDLNYRRLG
jgi:hypothetical protein